MIAISFMKDLIFMIVRFVKYLSRVKPKSYSRTLSSAFETTWKQWYESLEGLTLIDNKPYADNKKKLRRRKSFWQFKLNIFFHTG